MLVALDKLMELLERENVSLVITSARGGVHKRYSHHYKGLAVDVRTWDIQKPNDMCRLMRSVLGSDYQVINEPTHIHVEYDPEHIDE